MAEQQENKDWLDKLGEFFSKIFINPNKDIAYSIRKRGEDEIEIRDSIFDGYARGFIRFVLIINIKTLPILFVNEAIMRSRFEIPFLMVMLVDLFVLF